MFRAVIGDIEILMHSAFDRPAYDEPERVRWNGAVLSRDCAIGEVDFRGVIGRGATGQEVPWLAVGIDPPAAEDTCVVEIEAAITGPIDLSIKPGDQHRLAVVNGDLWRTDLDFEWHSF